MWAFLENLYWLVHAIIFGVSCFIPLMIIGDAIAPDFFRQGRDEGKTWWEVNRLWFGVLFALIIYGVIAVEIGNLIF